MSFLLSSVAFLPPLKGLNLQQLSPYILSSHTRTLPPHILTKKNSLSDSSASWSVSRQLLCVPLAPPPQDTMEEMPTFEVEEEALSDIEMSSPFFISDENAASFLFSVKGSYKIQTMYVIADVYNFLGWGMLRENQLQQRPDSLNLSPNVSIK